MMSMGFDSKRAVAVIVCAATLLSISACGQQGALTLPQPQQSEESSPPAEPTEE